MKKRNCKRCIHYFVCGYGVASWKIEHFLAPHEPTKAMNDGARMNRIHNFMAEKCRYFNKICRSKEVDRRRRKWRRQK